ncbi:hypothetical protein [Methanosarcina sp. 1.H.T.1A.1]|uniref:hypothetical protein n=1 Tax=Methanosarcina sp. 1.H.T.1A.1 TaxID=1483602 RepID=UPI0012DFFEBD|nr:hypothetical protein [Methanosarcina sp. 1.H.T.1A.1]
MAMGVQALESKTIERNNGAHASADWVETNDDVATYTYLSVTETDYGTDIYVSIWTYDETTGYSSEKYGYMFTEDNVFSIDKKLNSASLSEVEIDVSEWYYDETEEYYTFEEAGTLTVSADWTGIGDVSKGSYRSSSRDGDYVFRSAENSLSREAIATGLINGNDLGPSSYSWMNIFKSAYMSMEK